MAAPTASVIEASRTACLLAAGYVKRNVDGTAVVPNVLPDELKKLVQALSLADSNVWTAWQAAQVVNPLPTMNAGGVPVVGLGTLFP